MKKSPGDRRSLRWALPLLALFLCFSGCSEKSTSAPPSGNAVSVSAQPSVAPAPAAVTYTYQVVGTFPHDRAAFTQGLVYLKGVLFETTGVVGASSLRKVDLSSGRVLQKSDLPPPYFGEGMTVLGDKIYQVTWQSKKGFVFNLSSFELEKEFSYAGEGWGLTTDGHVLILSDGTHVLRFLDPVSFKLLRSIAVFDRGQPVRNLNELEFIKGEIYANVWQTNTVVRIDPANGALRGIIDFTGLLTPDDYRSGNTDVLNGIAYDAASDRLFVTGKNWPKLFEVQLKPK